MVLLVTLAPVALAGKPGKGDDCRGNQPCGNNTDVDVGVDVGVGVIVGGDHIGIDIAGDEVHGGAGGAGGAATADSNSNSESSADAESASNSAASSDNNVTFTNTHPSRTTVRNVASPDTPNVYPSAPCRIARSLGLSLAGGAMSGGGSIEDPECTLRETARTFQYLGVPEVGLHLMCTQSHVINGRYDKKGRLEKDSFEPIGADECLRLVRQFQGSVGEPDTASAFQAELEDYREKQDRVEQQLVSRVDELESELVELANKPRTVRVTNQTGLTDEQKTKLAQVFEK